MRNLREARRLTVRAVARKSKAIARTREESLTSAYLSQLERGKARNPSIHKLATLADIYGFMASSFISELRRRGLETSDFSKLDAMRIALGESSRSVGSLDKYAFIAHASDAIGVGLADDIHRLMLNNEAFRGLVSALAVGFMGGKRERDTVQRIFWDFFFDWEPSKTIGLLKKLPRSKTRRKAD